MADDLGDWRRSAAHRSPEAGHDRSRGLRSFDADDADFFLDLLPGTRGRDGLPESIRFWKARIEEARPGQDLRRGPASTARRAAGKSSLVGRDCCPSLAKSVVSIYVEATAEDTETRLLRGLRKHLPDLPDDLGLAEAVPLLRRGGRCPTARRS